ncbi:hypothetical protein DSO57_1013468 [Entomophthora muscae]|uniref:Uncharacterized protein n=1 Tax=Entomophthora muscae TaxID=34485 RepID=A0ACC2U3Q2_9FUNG|nr:hypothetical protein DSO57_1013468 [Entomophthora muscae]
MPDSDFSIFGSSPLTLSPWSPAAALPAPLKSTPGASADSFPCTDVPLGFLEAANAFSPLIEPHSSDLESTSSQNYYDFPFSHEEIEAPNKSQLCDSAATSENGLSQSKQKAQLKNTPRVIIRPKAVKFNFTPEVYNQEHLLQTYPTKFFLPIILDILKVSVEDLIASLERTVCDEGKPLLFRNFHQLPLFDKDIFSLAWLKANKGAVKVAIRDLKDKLDTQMPFDNFLEANHGKSHAEIRYYGKDIDCPPEWDRLAKKMLPPYLHYLGPNDLNNLLPEELRVENLMIYVGHEGTHTASHFDICGSVGHNLMVYADPGCSALWFMVERKYADKARKFWAENGGGNTSLDQDNFTISAEVLAQADFPVYVFEQQLGDFVMVPSESAHQVVNLGPGVNIKYSYSRNTVQSLDYCLHKILPVNRRILKMETYRIKAMIEQGVISLGQQLQSQKLELGKNYTADNLAHDYSILLKLYAEIIAMDTVDSSYTTKTQQQPKVCDDPMPHTRVCDFCHCDIWNSWYHCDTCIPKWGHDFCTDCVAENRQCLDYQRLTWYCHRPIQECFQDLQRYSEVYNSSPLISSQPSFSCVPLYSTISDLESLHPETYSSATLAVRNNDLFKIASYRACHQCTSSRFNRDMVQCTECKTRYYCHSCLTGKYGVNPIELSFEKSWTCYCCKGVCNCRKCKKKFGVKNTHSEPEFPCCLTDFNGNYYLGYGLSYFPIDYTKYLVPNLVDHHTFVATHKTIANAKSKTVQENLIPYTGPPNEHPQETARKQGVKRKAAENPEVTPKKLKSVDGQPKEVQISQSHQACEAN